MAYIVMAEVIVIGSCTWHTSYGLVMVMAYIVMADIVTADVVMAYKVMAYIVMAYEVVANKERHYICCTAQKGNKKTRTSFWIALTCKGTAMAAGPRPQYIAAYQFL